VEYHNVKADESALRKMLEYSSGRRNVPVIVENGNTKIGFGGT
jgi:glutaredoxin 3